MANYKRCHLLNSVRDIHKGQPALICGSGPSLNKVNWDKVPLNYITFVVNRSITIVPTCNYYVLTDIGVLVSNYWDEVAKKAEKVCFCSGYNFRGYKIGNFRKIKKRSLFFDRNYGSGSYCFDENPDLLICGTNVGEIAANLAYVMGCSPIILAGIDNCFVDKKMHCDTPYEVPNPSDQDLMQRQFDSWQLQWAAIKDLNPKINFLNASPLGRLNELFEPIDIC
jgi:hypothetical protein